MRTVVVRYETKPDRAENQRLVEQVFAELAQRRPDSFRYATFRLEDGGFVHVVIETDEASNRVSLADIDAFAESRMRSPTDARSSPSRKAPARRVPSLRARLNRFG